MTHRLLLLLAAATTVMVLMTANASAAWDPFGKACNTPGASGSTACQSQPGCSGTSCNPIGGTGGILYKASTIIALVTGIASIIVIMIGSFLFITSNGDAAKVKTARNAVAFALVGLAIVALAQLLVSFVISKL